MIRLKNIGLTFFNKTPLAKKALKNINLSIHEGDHVMVIGTNGAGKSTLLNMISGDLNSDTGEIFIANENVTRYPIHLRAHSVARVFQDPHAGTCGDLSIAQNMVLCAFRGKKRDLKFALCEEVLQNFRKHAATLNLKLEDRLDTPMSMLSGGQRQALSLIMTTLAPMKILLLDEHTAALDPKMAAFIMDLTARIVEEHKLTVLQVTHSLHQALHYGNRLIMMHNGEIVLDCPYEQKKKLTMHDLLGYFENYLEKE